MALNDARGYLYTMLNQYLEMQEDLKDFDEAFKDGYITEERLEEVKYEVSQLKENYDRIQYIMYLMEIPNRKAKKEKFHHANKRVEEYFKSIGADLDSIRNENKSIAAKIHKELKALTEKNK